MSNFLITFIDILFNIISLVILIRILLSWFRPDPNHPIVQFILSISEPILRPFRQPIFRLGMLDLSPIIAIIALEIIRTILTKIVIFLA